jgi:hypothetical protein
MKTKSSSDASRSGDRQRERIPPKVRDPVFPISREEVVRRCREKPHDMLCAGEVLALMDLMLLFHYTIKRLHELSGVARSMIHDMLVMEALPTNDTVGRLARAFGMEAIEFHLLGFFTLRAEVSP